MLDALIAFGAYAVFCAVFFAVLVWRAPLMPDDVSHLDELDGRRA